MADILLNPALSIGDALVLLSIAHGLIACWQLLRHSQTLPWWLLITVSSVCVLLLNYVGKRVGFFSGSYNLQVFSLWFLIAPSYFIHIAHLTYKRALPHLALPIAILMATLVIPQHQLNLFYTLSIPVFSLQSFLYFYFSLRKIRAIENQVTMAASDSRLLAFCDVRFMNILMLAWLVLDAAGAAWMLFDKQLSPLVSLATMLLLANWLCLLVPKLHALERFPLLAVPDPVLAREKGLGEGEARVLAVKLRELFERDKPYLKPDLKLGELATLLGVPAYKLSLLMKEHLEATFYDLVNAYRVRAAIREIQSGEHAKFLAVAFDSGFSSESSFYRVFRRYAGTTPSRINCGSQLENFPEIERLHRLLLQPD